MEKLLGMATVLALAGFGLIATAALVADVDVTGTWNCEIDVMGTAGTPVFTLKQDGTKLTGKYKGQFGEADVTGKVDGDKVEFSFEMMGLKVTYKGTVEDKDNMKGEANYGDMATGAWKGKRAPETKS